MRLFAAGCLAIFMAAVASALDEPAADFKPFVGAWKLEKAELAGANVYEQLKNIRFEILQDGGYVVKIADVTDRGTVTIDPKKSPKEMDIVGKEGPNRGKTFKTIYKLEDDTLTVCYELSGGDRPKEFATQPMTKLFLAVYSRKK